MYYTNQDFYFKRKKHTIYERKKLEKNTVMLYLK